MNLTDLGAELEARATEVPAVSAPVRIAGVRVRIRTRRRRQAGAVAVLAVVCLVAVGFSPITGNLLANRHQSPASHSKAKSANRFAFDDVLAGDPLITSVVGRRGQRDVQIVFTPQDTNLSVSAFCDIRDSPDGEAADLMGQVTVNGHHSIGVGCDRDASANSLSGSIPRDELAKMGVLPGKPSVLRVSLVGSKGKPVLNEQVLLGVGVYALTAPRLTSDGVVIPELAESYPHNYALVAYRTARITKTTRSLTLRVPAAKAGGWATGGNIVPDNDQDTSGVTTLLIGPDDQSQTESGGTVSGPVDPAVTTIEVRVSPSCTGTLMVAYYRQID